MANTKNALPTYEQHPIAIELMPGGMDEAEFNAFCEDVTDRGILMPVTLYEGKVLDGWHRYRAGHRTQTRWEEITYTGNNPAGYITSINVLRRKLGSLQRALVGARLHTMHNLTQREVCKKLGISNEVVTLVLKAMNSKNAKLIKRVETDSDFTRGMLREELEDAGILRAKEVDATPLGANSVFALGSKKQDTDGSDDDDDYDAGLKVGSDKLPSTVGAKVSHSERKPKPSAAHILSEGFKALMADEKETFLRMIWPEAKSIAKTAGIFNDTSLPVKVKQDTPLKALKRATKKQSKEVEELL
jgi:transcriptional regulator with XRE-family HTH domain